MHLIIDGDGPLYRAAAAAQHYEYYIDGLTFRLKKDAVSHAKDTNYDVSDIKKSDLIVEEEYAAIHNIKSIMDGLLSAISPKSYTCYIGGNGNYRHLINPEYKAGRPPRPVHYDAVKRYMAAYNAEEVHGIEADDACSMMQCSAEPETTMIASNDKDLLMVPGWHYNWQKQIKQFITEDQGDYNFYIQLCTGDSTDNIYGLAGIGPAKAAKIIEGCTTARARFEAVSTAYQSAGREDLHTVARQIWMSRLEPDDWEEPK